MVVKLSDFLTTSLVLTALDSAGVINVMRSTTIGIDSNTTGDYVSGITGGTGINATGTGHAAAVTLSVDNTVVTADSAQTLTNKTFNLSNNTFQATLSQLNAAVSGATLVSLDGAETLTNKTLTTPTINGGSFTAGSVVDISTFGLRDATTSAYETRIRSNNASPVLSADRTLTLDVNNADRTISLTGNLVLGGTLTTSGAHNTTFTTSGTTSLTLPTTGTLVSSTDFSTRFDSDLATKTTTNVTEGTNLYYTQARFDSAFGDKTTTNLTEGSNLYYTQGRFDTAFAAKSTTNLSEGNNLYYTQVRVDSAFDARLTTKSTTDVSEGTNLYYTTARSDSDFDVRLATKSTTNLSEGSNLYYTTVRVDSDIDARVTKSFVENLNISASTLGSLDSTQFLRSDQTDTITGTIIIDGTSGQGLIISNAVAQIKIGSGGNTGPHGLYFYKNTGTVGIQQLYRTTPNVLYWEDSADNDLMALNTDGDLTVTGSLATEGGTDGGLTLKDWTANTAYGILATGNMSGNEYIVASRGDDTLISAATGGQVILRSDANNTTNQLVVDSTGSTIGGNTILTSASDSSEFPSNIVIFDGNGDINFQSEGDLLKWGSLYLEGRTTGQDELKFYVNNTHTTSVDGYGYLVQNGKSYGFKNAAGTFFTNLEAVDPTADRTITFPNETGDVAVIGTNGITIEADPSYVKAVIFENTAGTHSTYLTASNATFSRIITLPDVAGTVLTTGNAADLISTLKTVDSNGSGLNADTLDGQQGSYYRIDVYDASGTLLN